MPDLTGAYSDCNGLLSNSAMIYPIKIGRLDACNKLLNCGVGTAFG
jgi:hypothetical protein